MPSIHCCTYGDGRLRNTLPRPFPTCWNSPFLLPVIWAYLPPHGFETLMFGLGVMPPSRLPLTNVWAENPSESPGQQQVTDCGKKTPYPPWTTPRLVG